MVRIRHLLVLAVVATVLVPAAARAAAPRVYGSTDPGRSIAFAATGDRVSILGVDTHRYCGYTEPTQNKKPGAYHPLAAPLAMKGGASGLTAVEDESEMQYPAQLTVDADFSGPNLVGDYGYVATEGSLRCQTGTYYPGEATVPFEAVPFVPSGEPGAAAPNADETPIYFSRQGPFEIFVRGEGKTLLVRGAITSKCKFGGAHKSSRSPFFGVAFPLPTELESFGGFFGDTAKQAKGKRVTEVTRLSGSVSETAIDGIYSRRSVTGEGKYARKCSIGPLRFHADRYLPAAP